MRLPAPPLPLPPPPLPLHLPCGAARLTAPLLPFIRSGDVSTSGLGEGAHAMAVLVNDGTLPEPRVKAEVDISAVKPQGMDRGGKSITA